MQEVATPTAPAKRRGRPAGSVLPADERKSEMIRLRVTKAMRKKYDELGGDTWMRERITKARP